MKIIWSQWALDQLDQAYEYWLAKAGLRVAQNITDALLSGVTILKQYPNAGQLESWLEHKGKGHRRLVIGKYKLIYRIEGQVIWITDVFETHLDPKWMSE